MFLVSFRIRSFLILGGLYYLLYVTLSERHTPNNSPVRVSIRSEESALCLTELYFFLFIFLLFSHRKPVAFLSNLRRPWGAVGVAARMSRRRQLSPTAAESAEAAFADNARGRDTTFQRAGGRVANLRDTWYYRSVHQSLFGLFRSLHLGPPKTPMGLSLPSFVPGFWHCIICLLCLLHCNVQ